MKKQNFIYVVTKNDDLELPEFYDDTLKGLSEMTGYSFDCLFKAFKRGSIFDGKYRINKVMLDDKFDDFDSFEDYDIFCKKLLLQKSSPSSLDLFKAYCCGV